MDLKGTRESSVSNIYSIIDLQNDWYHRFDSEAIDPLDTYSFILFLDCL